MTKLSRLRELAGVPQRLHQRSHELRRRRHAHNPGASETGELAARVSALEEAVDENRRLNQRLADVIDVVTEVLVPALDRDDERVRKALEDLDQTLNQAPTRT
jgi:small-conductance mechanosensitive channel